VTSPVNNPEEPTVSDPYAALPARLRPAAGTPGFGAAPTAKDEADAAPDPNYKPRDKRWFLRIVAWIVLAFGVAIFAFGAMPNDRPTNPGDVISSSQMMVLASLPFVAFGVFLVWWGYSRVGEPMVACKQCLHINKPRSTDCKKCGNQLG
jgi:hypothetical protein